MGGVGYGRLSRFPVRIKLEVGSRNFDKICYDFFQAYVLSTWYDLHFIVFLRYYCNHYYNTLLYP